MRRMLERLKHSIFFSALIKEVLGCLICNPKRWINQLAAFMAYWCFDPLIVLSSILRLQVVQEEILLPLSRCNPM